MKENILKKHFGTFKFKRSTKEILKDVDKEEKKVQNRRFIKK